MSDDTICKGCKRETHPAYLTRYDGYCLDCHNTDVPQRDEEIRKKDLEIKDLKRRIDEFRGVMERNDELYARWQTDGARIAELEAQLAQVRAELKLANGGD